MFKPTSRLRHKSKRKLVQMCIEKEKDGWRCIVPIHHSDQYFKHFSQRDGRYEFDNVDSSSFYEAVYKKRVSE